MLDPMTGIAPSRVATNSQAIVSAGALLDVRGGSVSYGNPMLIPDRSGGVRTSTWATQNGPSELMDIEHWADIGGTFPLGVLASLEKAVESGTIGRQGGFVGRRIRFHLRTYLEGGF